MSTSGPRPDPDLDLVEGDRAGSWLVRVGGRDQSLVDLVEPTRLAFDYVRRTREISRMMAPSMLGGASTPMPGAATPGGELFKGFSALGNRVRSRYPPTTLTTPWLSFSIAH